MVDLAAVWLIIFSGTGEGAGLAFAGGAGLTGAAGFFAAATGFLAGFAGAFGAGCLTMALAGVALPLAFATGLGAGLALLAAGFFAAGFAAAFFVTGLAIAFFAGLAAALAGAGFALVLTVGLADLAAFLAGDLAGVLVLLATEIPSLL